MEKGNTSLLVVAFVALIMGIAFIGVIANSGNEVTNKITISEETIDYTSAVQVNGTINSSVEFTIANVPDGWRVTGCPISSFDLYNSTSSLTVVDYTFTASTGVITFNNSANVNGTATNETSATYIYCNSEYLTQGWNRTIIDLIPGFFALALMGVGIGLFYEIGKREGLWNT